MVKAKLRLALASVTLILVCMVFYKAWTMKDSNMVFEQEPFVGYQFRKLNQPFSWHNSDGDDEAAAAGDDAAAAAGDEAHNVTVISSCRNSVQGKVLIADDRGYVCSRKDIQSNGCCHPNATSTSRYACSDCLEASGCCKIYENCISCCMDPQKKPELMKVLHEANALKNILLLSVSDHFELCLAKCRTSSTSVQHENVYINPKYKHCFMRNPPTPG